MKTHKRQIGRVEIQAGEYVLSASIEGEIVISKIRDRDFVCHSDNVGHLILCFSALLEFAAQKERAA